MPIARANNNILKVITSGGSVDLETTKPAFIHQMTGDTNDITFDARLDNFFFKLPAGYRKVIGIKNADAYANIPTGIITYDNKDIEIIASFFVNSFSQWSSIISNSYISDNVNYFAIACGQSNGTVNCFVNTDYMTIQNTDFSNGSALLLKYNHNDGKRIAKDVLYPYKSFLSTHKGTSNESEISLFTKSPALKTIYSFYCKQDGVVVADYIPCVREFDGKPGFFDKISGIFKTDENNTLIAVE